MKVIGGYTFLYTVGDLKKYLKRLPDETPLHSCDADLGGYDVCTHTFVNPVLSEEPMTLYLGHLEYDAWSNDRMIYEQYFQENTT